MLNIEKPMVYEFGLGVGAACPDCFAAASEGGAWSLSERLSKLAEELRKSASVLDRRVQNLRSTGLDVWPSVEAMRMANAT